MEGSGGKKGRREEEEKRGEEEVVLKKEEGREEQTLKGGLPGRGFPTVCMEGTVAGYIKTGDTCTPAYLET